MNKKLLLALTLLAVVLSGTALGLWSTIKGKTEDAMKKSSMLSPKYAPKGDFADRMNGIGRAYTALQESEALTAKQKDELEANVRTIEQNNKKIKDLETNVSELETQRSDLTRVKGELEGKVDSLQSKATLAETKVKDLEAEAAKNAEEHQQKLEELQTALDASKGALQDELKKARDFYSKLYNFSTSKGLNMPADLTDRPWEGTTVRQSGPRFAANSLVAQIVAFDARLGFAVLNVGGDAGLLRDQGFDVLIGDVSVGKLRIGEILNGSVSSGYLLKGTDLTKFSAGTMVKLVPLGSSGL